MYKLPGNNMIKATPTHILYITKRKLPGRAEASNVAVIYKTNNGGLEPNMRWRQTRLLMSLVICGLQHVIDYRVWSNVLLLYSPLQLGAGPRADR